LKHGQKVTPWGENALCIIVPEAVLNDPKLSKNCEPEKKLQLK